MRQLLLLVGLLAAGYLLFIHGLADRDLWSSHEARAAQNAQTMVDSGQWLLPRLYDGRVELQKPPLYYWLIAASASMGRDEVTAWDVRLPAALAGLGGCALLVLFGWYRGRARAGVIAAVVVGTMLHYVWLGRVGRIDMAMTFAISAAVLAFYLGWHRIGKWPAAWLAGGYVACAGAILLKGPLGLVLPLFIMGSHLLAEGALHQAWRTSVAIRVLHRCGIWWGLPLVLLLVVPWFVAAEFATQGEFLTTFLWKHNLQRGLGGAADLEANPDAWWFYLLRLGPDLFPWSLLLLPALAVTWRRGLWTMDREARFGLTWFLVTLLFFSVMRFKRADYLLPAYPGAALWLGSTLDAWSRQIAPARQRFALATLGGCVAACAVGWWIFTHFVQTREEPHRELRSFAASVRQYVPRPGLVIVFREEGHLLGYHLERPYERLMEWENLDVWACQPVPVYVILSRADFAESERRLEAGRVEYVTSTYELAGGRHDEEMVLCRSCPFSTGFAGP